MLDVVEKAGVHRHQAPLELVGHPAEIAEGRGGARHVEHPGVADRMAGVDRFDVRQLFGPRFDRVGELQQQPPAVGRADPAPGGKCLGRGRDRLVDIGLAGLGDVGNFRVVVRIEDFDSAARLRVDEFTRDE